MREPEKFPKVLKKSMIIISLAMFLVGGLSYYIFGDEVIKYLILYIYIYNVIITDNLKLINHIILLL